MDRPGQATIHERPNRSEVVACHQWLQTEVDLVDPEVVVALGATAGQSLVGPSFRVGGARTATLEVDGRPLVGTLHPSAVLRARGSTERAEAFEWLVGDLRRAGALLS